MEIVTFFEYRDLEKVTHFENLNVVIVTFFEGCIILFPSGLYDFVLDPIEIGLLSRLPK